jgi:hypothetical protein
MPAVAILPPNNTYSHMYANLPDQGLVSGYDLNAPPWGQTAQQVRVQTITLSKPFRLSRPLLFYHLLSRVAGLGRRRRCPWTRHSDSAIHQRRMDVDRLRLQGRANTRLVARHQLPLWHHGHRWLSKGQVHCTSCAIKQSRKYS